MLNLLREAACLKKVLLGCICLLLTGCVYLIEMHLPSAPSEVSWKKEDATQSEVVSALIDCGKLTQQHEQLMRGSTSFELDDFNSICMLRKGFKFVPKADGYANWCLMNHFSDSIACKSMDSDFVLPPEQ